MISFNAWRKIQKGETLSESFLGLGAMTLGFGNQPTKIGLSEKSFTDGDKDIVEPGEDKDDPDKVSDEELEGDDDGNDKAMKTKKCMSYMKKGGKGKKKGKKSCGKMMKNEEVVSEEEAKWWESVRSQLGSNPNQKFGTGLDKITEDKLIDPAKPAEKDETPGPGEVGYAPNGRIGAIGSYAEWSAKHFPKK